MREVLNLQKLARSRSLLETHWTGAGHTLKLRDN